MSVKQSKGAGDLPLLTLSHPSGATARVYLHGAHVTSWRSGGREYIFVSERAIYQPKKAIRGGIPICWPQFSNSGSLPSHGFVRDRSWNFAGSEHSNDTVIARLSLTHSTETYQVWPHQFELIYTVTLAASALSTHLEVHNRGQSAFTFTCALHTYLTVPSGIRAVDVQGLGGCDFIDKTRAAGRFHQDEASLRIVGETDRMYVNAPAQITVRSEARPVVAVHKDAGLPEAVVWNVWEEKVKSMADMAPHEYDKYICIEAANIVSPVSLAPGARWHAGQTLVATNSASL